MPSKLFQRWHLLSLDAPTVAAVWTAFVAHCCGIHLPVSAIAAMFLAVWMLYAADRLLDASVLDLSAAPSAQALSQLEARHHFHHQHRRAFLGGIVLSAIMLAILLPGLNPDALRLYSLLASLLFSWFLLVHLRLAESGRLPKEIAVAVFFPAAVFIPTVARRPDLRAGLLLPAFLFASVCALNCLYLYAWEHPSDQTQAHWTTRLAISRLPLITIALTTATLLCATLRYFAPSTFAVALAFPAACSAASAILLLLHVLQSKVAPVTLRAAADLALLTPVLFLR